MSGVTGTPGDPPEVGGGPLNEMEGGESSQDGLFDPLPPRYMPPLQHMCGTYGCTLPNNHRGLHKIPEDEASTSRKRRRPEFLGEDPKGAKLPQGWVGDSFDKEEAREKVARGSANPEEEVIMEEEVVTVAAMGGGHVETDEEMGVDEEEEEDYIDAGVLEEGKRAEHDPRGRRVVGRVGVLADG